MGTGDAFPGGKAAGREANYSIPSSAEGKNGGDTLRVPPFILHLHGVVLN
jgi:hypothetical protein